jgi:hypothetical protein
VFVFVHAPSNNQWLFGKGGFHDKQAEPYENRFRNSTYTLPVK